MTDWAWGTSGTYYLTVPVGVTSLTFWLAGAAGGDEYSASGTPVAVGGRGATLYRFTVTVTPGEVLQVNVGGRGGNGTASSSGAGAGEPASRWRASAAVQRSRATVTWSSL